MTKPEDMIRDYKVELERLYGKEIADASRCDYSGGWFYICKASLYQDGSVGAGGRMAKGFRRKKVAEMIATLRKRESNSGSKD